MLHVGCCHLACEQALLFGRVKRVSQATCHYANRLKSIRNTVGQIDVWAKWPQFLSQSASQEKFEHCSVIYTTLSSTFQRKQIAGYPRSQLRSVAFQRRLTLPHRTFSIYTRVRCRSMYTWLSLNIHSFPNANLNHGAVSSTLFNFKSDSLLFKWTGCSLQFSIPDRKKVRIYPLWKANFSYLGNPSSGNLFTAAAWRLLLSVTLVPQKHQAELTDAYMSW